MDSWLDVILLVAGERVSLSLELLMKIHEVLLSPITCNISLIFQEIKVSIGFRQEF